MTHGAKMLLSRTRLVSFPVSFSLETFIKHLECTTTLTPTRRSTSTISSILNACHFENLNPLQKQQVHLYTDTLLDWNQKLNLTAVRDVNEVMDRHIEDSLAIIPPIGSSHVSSSEKLNVGDVGSGAGAITCPDWNLTLLESLNKRCVFLEHVVGLIGLSNAKVVRGRAEDVGQNLEFREVFDIAVARAVAEMRILAEYCLPLVCVGGLFVAAKGHSPEEEVRRANKAIQMMGASLLQTCYVNSHSPYGHRTAIVCLKDGPTPKKYPHDPDWNLTLLESLNKRCVLLEHVFGLIGLSNAKVVRGRAEDVGQNLEFREAFDIVVSRAVAEMRILGTYNITDVLAYRGGMNKAVKLVEVKPKPLKKRRETGKTKLHSHDHKILIIYDHDFSLSHSIAYQRGDGSDIIAVSFYTEDEVKNKFDNAEDNINSFIQLGGTVYFAVRALSILNDKQINGQLYNQIIYNHPYLPSLSKNCDADTIMKNKNYISTFLGKAARLIEEDGEIILTIKANQPYDQLDIRGLVNQQNLAVKTQIAFPKKDYPYYVDRQSPTQSSSTYVIVKRPIEQTNA